MTLAAAETAFRRGDMRAAEAALAGLRRLTPNDAKAWHLTALVAERDGREGDALAAYARAVTLAPRDPGLAVEYAGRLGARDPAAALARLGQVIAALPGFVDAWLTRGRLLHRLGRYAESRADLLRVYQLAPRRLDGWLARGAMERDAGVPTAAGIAYDHALAIAPDDATALHGRARIALELGAADAAVRYAAAARALPHDREVAIGAAEARELDGDPEAETPLATMVAADPGWVEGQTLLARMRWEAGDPAFDRDLRAAVTARPGEAVPAMALATLLAGVDRFGDAADVVATVADDPAMRLAESIHALSAGDVARSLSTVAAVPTALPGRLLHQTRLAIRTGDLAQAALLVEPLIAEDGDAVAHWATAGLVWRAIGDPRADWLLGQPGLIAARRLALDDAEVAAIARHLRGLHTRLHHPPGQSMRGGTQTRGRLLSRQEPPVQRLRQAIGEAVMAHWAALPPRDDRHPLLRHRDRGPTLAGSWSVRLTDGGRHVPHIHPEGVLSSASYWIAPPDGADGAGRLEVGRAPDELGLDLPPLASFAPEPGSLVLFPSIVYHATRPTRGERITVAFDIAAG